MVDKNNKNKLKESKNPCTKVKVEKITLNIGTGKDQNYLEKALKLLNNLTNKKPVKTKSNFRIAAWGIRKGLPIGCKVTLRGEDALNLIPRVLDAKDFILPSSSFDDNGNISFGIQEYIDIKDAKYDPEIPMMGLQVCITLSKPGRRVKLRRIKPSKLPLKQRVNKEESITFMKDNFNIKLYEETIEEE